MNRELWRVPASGGQAIRILDYALRPAAVFPDGIYYPDNQENGRIRFFDFSTGLSKTVVRDLGTTLGISVSPDRRTILYARVDSTDADLMLVENFK
jgi:hypothetical protein